MICANILDGFAVQRARSADALESVVFGRIVAAGNHDGAVCVQVLRRVVKHWSGDRADVGDVAACREETFHQRIAQARGAEPAIASDVNIGAAAVSPKVSAQAAAELLDIRTKEFGIRDAANIVLAENGRLEHIF